MHVDFFNFTLKLLPKVGLPLIHECILFIHECILYLRFDDNLSVYLHWMSLHLLIVERCEWHVCQ